MRAFPVSSREQWEMELVVAHHEGASLRALSRMFKVSRNTVRRLLREKAKARGEASPQVAPEKTPRPLPRRGKLEPYLPALMALLEQYPRLSAVRLKEEIAPLGYTGGLSILREKLRRTLRPAPPKEGVLRFETAPGEQGQMDWSPYTVRYADGRKETVLCFSYILAFSRRQYIDFTLRRDFHTLIRRHQDAFAHFGGVPRGCLYDGEKTVLLRWEGGYPVYNPAFVAFATHYQLRPIGCKVGRAQTKGKIERPFQYVEGNFLAGRTFRDLEDLRRGAAWWLAQKSDTHVHETMGRPPVELFLEAEKEALQPLPRVPYDSCEAALRVGSVDGYVDFEGNRYSIAYAHVGLILTVKATESEVRIYGKDLTLLCTHSRAPRGAGQTLEDPAHHVPKKDRYGLEPVREQFLELGPSADAFLEGLIRKHRHYCGYSARYILTLKDRYHTQDIHKALVRASAYGAFEYQAVERILVAKARPRALEALDPKASSERLARVLPRIRQRPLEEYSLALLTQEQSDEQEQRAYQDPPAHNDHAAGAPAHPEACGDGEASE